MREQLLNGKKIALLSADGFQVHELLEPKKALELAGAEVFIISLNPGVIRGWEKKDWATATVKVDYLVSEVSADDFDALMIPGGVLSPDTLRGDKAAVRFVKAFAEASKPIAAICHGPQILIDADVVQGKKLTSFASIRTDLINAGADWVDEAVVCDSGLITSRKPADLPEFNIKMIEEFAEGIHEEYHRTHLTQVERLGLQ